MGQGLSLAPFDVEERKKEKERKEKELEQQSSLHTVMFCIGDKSRSNINKKENGLNIQVTCTHHFMIYHP